MIEIIETCSCNGDKRQYRPDEAETICPADGHFRRFRRLGDTDNHARW